MTEKEPKIVAPTKLEDLSLSWIGNTLENVQELYEFLRQEWIEAHEKLEELGYPGTIEEYETITYFTLTERIERLANDK